MEDTSIQLLWIPLGAGARVVRFSGRVFEAICAGLARRPRRALYHSALVITVAGATTSIEVGPVLRGDAPRGVVAEGAVGSRWLRRWRIFRYEVRRGAGETIPDADAAVGGPVLLARDPDLARRIVALVPSVPVPTWGRDELRCGEMWNSNSVTSWLLAQAGLDVGAIALPDGGRAPGWDAGIVQAGRPPRPVEAVRLAS